MEDKNNQPNVTDNSAGNNGNVVGPAAPSAPDMPASPPAQAATPPPVAPEPTQPLTPAPTQEHKSGMGKLVKRFVIIVAVLLVLALAAIYILKI